MKWVSSCCEAKRIYSESLKEVICGNCNKKSASENISVILTYEEYDDIRKERADAIAWLREILTAWRRDRTGNKKTWVSYRGVRKLLLQRRNTQ